MDQGQFSDPDFISGTHQRENVQLPIKICHQTHLTGPSNYCKGVGYVFRLKFMFETGGQVKFGGNLKKKCDW